MTKKEVYLQIRATEDDKKLANDLAEDYGISMSELVRFALKYIDAQRPALTITITPMGKVLAPALEMAA